MAIRTTFASKAWAVLLLVAVCCAAQLWTRRIVEGTPELAARAGHNCNSCHAEMSETDKPPVDQRHTLNCISCHVNPLGGGMRREGGVFFSNFTLPARVNDADSPVNGVLTKTVTVGIDSRLLWLFPELDKGAGTSAEQSFFLPMENDLYLCAKLTPHVSVYSDVYAGAATPVQPREFFALADDLPYNSWVMAGYFLTPFGLKLDDHTIFTRQNMGFNMVGSSDGGVAFGMSPGKPYFDLAIMNGVAVPPFQGNGGAINNPGNRLYKSISGHLGYWQEVVQEGLTWYFNVAAPVRLGDPPTYERMLGLYHTGVIGPFSWLGELDVEETQNISPLSEPYNHFPGRGDNPYLTHRLAAFGELSYQVQRGLSANLIGDWYDGQWESYDNVTPRQYRAIVGANWYPVPFVEFLAFYRCWFASDHYDHSDLFFQLHLFL